MIIFVHLLNDRSGSPRVLHCAINALRSGNDRSLLFLGSQGKGILNDSHIRIILYWYRRSSYQLVTLFTYFLSQAVLFVRLCLLRRIDNNSIVYVNTLLPFGAALYGLITGKKVVYHLHEVSISPQLFKSFLVFIARITASKLLYVSDYHRNSLPIGDIPFKVIPNPLDNVFIEVAAASQYTHLVNGSFRVLMVASLKDYKGLPEFLNLSNVLLASPHIEFILVLNEEKFSVDRYFSRKKLGSNLEIYSRTDDLTSHYSNASLLLNLSRPDKWVETFGLTLLEAMAFGVPVIAPPVGGPAELVRHGSDGFLIDSRNIDQLAQTIIALSSDPYRCHLLSTSARERASEYSSSSFSRNLRYALMLPFDLVT